MKEIYLRHKDENFITKVSKGHTDWAKEVVANGTYEEISHEDYLKESQRILDRLDEQRQRDLKLQNNPVTTKYPH